ncbi:MAG: hypothetical protein V4724_37755 [Pseudomonadota bacterium]
MPQVKPSRSQRHGVAFEEEKVWISFYRRVGDPAIAVEVMNQLDSDPELKRMYLALYLRCKESLRTHKARQERNKRIGQFVRMLLHAVFVLPLAGMQRWLRHGGDIAVECLPEVAREPAARRVQKLSKEAEFEQAKSTFSEQAPAKPTRKSQSSSPQSNAA